MLRASGLISRATRVVIASTFIIGTAKAVLVNQLETFSSGSAGGWHSGENAGTQPSVTTSGGPAGTNDRYLSVFTSGTHNTQSRLVVFTTDPPWAGDYATTGVTGLEMDLKNFGDAFGTPVTLQIRLAFKETTGSTSAGFSTVFAMTLPDDGQWHHAFFSFRSQDFEVIGSPTKTLSQILSAPGEVRILNSAQPALKGDLVDGLVQLGIDNIRAVPEPTTAAATLTGAGILIACRRRR